MSKKKFSWNRRFNRRIKRFLKSRRGRVAVIFALAIGTSIAVACHPVTRRIIVGYWSRFNFFNSANEDNTTSIPSVETSTKSSIPTWKKLGLFGGIVVILGVAVWSGKIQLNDFNFFNREDEVVKVPAKSYDPSTWDSYPLPSGRRGWLIVTRTLTGAALIVLSIPATVVTNSVKIGATMYFTGYQMVTWPTYT